ncbi:MAG: branched-chain amino acid transaminase [Anaerolineae bacterium]|nr:branched-chain amino acid transaminase [Chloroflexota bacterium]MBK9747989.1 branched-chain amino acid transaminase [Chloroflexota bacterium]MBN8634357.1 branched-chain amino acid transaminase [Anaerolineae bacterium]
MAEQGKPKFAFFEGKIVPIEDAKISVMTHAFNYGTGVFGGLRGYWNDDENQLFVFRPHDHFERLTQSASLLRINVPHSVPQLVGILNELLRTEGFRENVYIRPLAYKSTEMIGVRLHDVDDEITMFAMPFGRYVEKEEGLHVGFSSWRRVDDNAIPARGKITGAYANSALIKSDAVLAGYDEALVLNEDGHLAEASAANLFIVRKGVVYTPPVESNVLEGIVRRSLITLMRDELGLDVVERNVDRTEVYIADEMIMCGTGVQVAAVTRVEHRAIGSGQMGPITRKVRDLFFDVVRGRVDKYREWLTPVYENVTAK